MRPFSIRWPKSAIISNTDCLIHASTAFRKTGNASTLSLIDILEPRVDEKYFLDTLDDMVEQAFDDQCTGANPRLPLMSEIKDMYLRAYYGKE